MINKIGGIILVATFPPQPREAILYTSVICSEFYEYYENNRVYRHSGKQKDPNAGSASE